MPKLHIKKGDRVRILAGESRGEEGRVIKVYPAKGKAIVEGEGIKKAMKHAKPNAANPQGGIVKQDIPIHVSNLAVIDGQGNATRIGRKHDENGKLVRYSKKSEEVLK